MTAHAITDTITPLSAKLIKKQTYPVVQLSNIFKVGLYIWVVGFFVHSYTNRQQFLIFCFRQS